MLHRWPNLRCHRREYVTSRVVFEHHCVSQLDSTNSRVLHAITSSQMTSDTTCI